MSPIVWIKPQPYLNQNAEKHDLKDFESPDCVNVTSPQTGIIDVALGYSQIGNTLAGTSKVQGLHDFAPTTGGNTLHEIYNGTLYKLVNNVFTSMQTGLNNSDMYCMVNHLDRHYICSPNQGLFYVTSSTKTDVTSVKVKYLDVVENILVGFNVVDTTFGQHGNYIIYSKPGSDQFYADGGSYATSTYYGYIDGEIVAGRVYGRNIIAWTNNDMWVWPISNLTASTSGPQRFCEVGCANNFAVTELEGMLIWANYDGIWVWTGTGFPTLISKLIQNDDKSGDYDQITDFSLVRLGSIGRKLVVYLGASINGYSNVVQIFDLNKKNWERKDNHPVSIFTKAIQNGKRNLYFGQKATGKVEEFNDGTTYDGTAIEAVYKTKPLDFAISEAKTFNRIYFLYEPSNENMIVNMVVDNKDIALEKTVVLAGTAGNESMLHILADATKARSIILTLTNPRGIKEIGFDLDVAAYLDGTPVA